MNRYGKRLGGRWRNNQDQTQVKSRNLERGAGAHNRRAHKHRRTKGCFTSDESGDNTVVVKAKGKVFHCTPLTIAQPDTWERVATLITNSSPSKIILDPTYPGNQWKSLPVKPLNALTKLSPKTIIPRWRFRMATKRQYF